MSVSPHSRRFADSTRGRIAELLRVRPMTIDEIAARLKLTSNAVRAQMMLFESDGVVHKAGVRAIPSRSASETALDAPRARGS